MSVNYNAKYGYGFVVTEEDIRSLTPEQQDMFMDSEFFYEVDGWRDDKETPYFFGIVIKSLDPGETTLIPSFDVFKPEELKKMTDEFKTYNHLFYKYHQGPRHYMFCCVI